MVAQNVHLFGATCVVLGQMQVLVLVATTDFGWQA